jgi:hypothetical protein
MEMVPSWMKWALWAAGWVERYARTRRSPALGIVMEEDENSAGIRKDGEGGGVGAVRIKGEGQGRG